MVQVRRSWVRIPVAATFFTHKISVKVNFHCLALEICSYISVHCIIVKFVSCAYVADVPQIWINIKKNFYLITITAICSASTMTIDHGWIHFNQHCTLLIILANVQSQSWSLKNKLSNAGCTQGAWMGSQLHNNFQASQVVHGADDVCTTPEPGQFNEDLWSPSYCTRLECPVLFY